MWLNIYANHRFLITYSFQGHIETIFDCKFKPESPDLLATASFDGTIKVWDVNTMTAVSVNSVLLVNNYTGSIVKCLELLLNFNITGAFFSWE